MTRFEDDRLLRGLGHFSDDLDHHGVLVGGFFRAVCAHAHLRGVRTQAARAMPGIFAVYTMEDLRNLIPTSPPALDMLRNADGTEPITPRRPAMATDRIRFAGEPVAFVVGISPSAVADALELIEVDVDTSPVHLDLQPDGVPLHDTVADNVGFDWRGGDADASEIGFARASETVTLEVKVPRIHGAPLEPQAALAAFDPVSGRWTLTVPSQGVHRLRSELALHYLEVEEEALRIITPDVGGAFGLRIHALPEHAVLLAAARLLRRPVRWLAGRLETMVAEPHCRDYAITASLALDAEGRILAMRADARIAIGAYVLPGSRGTPTASLLLGLQGPYRVPALDLRVRGIYTNNTSTGPFRGAGQPEGSYVRECLLDEAARLVSLDPVELRRRNLLDTSDFPHRAVNGAIVDGGDPLRLLAQATRHTLPLRPGRLSGRGVALYLKMNGMGRTERCLATLQADGRVHVAVGSQSNGQGHETVFAGLAATTLELPATSVVVVQGDSDALPGGTGTGASSALQTSGSGVVLSSRDLLRQARGIAAFRLGVAEDALRYADGVFDIPGTNRGLSLADLAGEALVGRSDVGVTHSFTLGCHVCDVLVDPETGQVTVGSYVAVDDLGRVVDPALAAGQIQGGVAQGLGQALLETQRYDAETAQPLALTFMDYALPRAADIPDDLSCMFSETATGANPLGVRGAGEAGAMASMAAVANAVNAALGSLRTARVDAPLTAEAVWRGMGSHGAAA